MKTNRLVLNWFQMFNDIASDLSLCYSSQVMCLSKLSKFKCKYQMTQFLQQCSVSTVYQKPMPKEQDVSSQETQGGRTKKICVFQCCRSKFLLICPCDLPCLFSQGNFPWLLTLTYTKHAEQGARGIVFLTAMHLSEKRKCQFDLRMPLMKQ